jgi:hypothetical protein
MNFDKGGINMKFNTRKFLTALSLILVFTLVNPISAKATTQTAPTNFSAAGKYVPAIVTSTGTVPAQKGIELKWTAPTLVENYEIHRSTSSSGPFILIKTINAPASRFFDTTVNVGVVYYYKIRAYHTHLLVKKDYSSYTSTVYANYVPVSRIDASPKEYRPVLGGPTLRIGYTTIAVSPYVPTYKSVKFTSSNSNICSVSSTGVLTGKLLGKATITITSIESPTVKTTVVCNPKIGHETSTDLMQKEILRTWGSPYKYLADGKTLVTILPVAGTGRAFGALREDGRYHAGVDLAVSKSIGNKTPVYAMTSGTSKGCGSFWGGTRQLTVQNDDGTRVQYGEISPSSAACTVGSRITKGTQIGVLIPNNINGGTMIHLVLYKGTTLAKVSSTLPYLYVPNKVYKDYSRDLLNPDFLTAKCTIK